MVNDDNIATRLIPAHAGSTLEVRVNGTRGRAHPRSRGEHGEGEAGERDPFGSSPLTRGALAYVWRVLGQDGLIPAHAGSTSMWRVLPLSLLGSSPLTRGAPGVVGYALKALMAHPRSRGEH